MSSQVVSRKLDSNLVFSAKVIQKNSGRIQTISEHPLSPEKKFQAEIELEAAAFSLSFLFIGAWLSCNKRDWGFNTKGEFLRNFHKNI